MALLGGGAGDRLPARQPLRRRSGNRTLGLDRDEPPDPDRGAALDHGVEVRVRQHRLQKRDSNLGLTLNWSNADDPPNDATAVHLNDLDLVFRSLGYGDATLSWANAQHTRQGVSLRASYHDPATGDSGCLDEGPEQCRPMLSARWGERKPAGAALYSRAYGEGRAATTVVPSDLPGSRRLFVGPGRDRHGQQLHWPRPPGQLRHRMDHYRGVLCRRVPRLVLALGGPPRCALSARGVWWARDQRCQPGGDRWGAYALDAAADGHRRLQRVAVRIPGGAYHTGAQRARGDPAPPAAGLGRLLRPDAAGAPRFHGGLCHRPLDGSGGVTSREPAGRAAAGGTGRELPGDHRRTRRRAGRQGPPHRSALTGDRSAGAGRRPAARSRRRGAALPGVWRPVARHRQDRYPRVHPQQTGTAG